MKAKIIKYLEAKNSKSATFKELVKLFNINPGERKMLKGIIKDMEKEGSLYIVEKDIILSEVINTVSGVIAGHENGFGFLIRNDGIKPDIYIASNRLKGALNKDEVEVIIDDENDERPSGEVIKIIKRGNTFAIGTFCKKKDGGYVVPDDSRLCAKVIIDEDSSAGANDKQKVQVELTRFKEYGNPKGKIVAVLGYPGVNETDMQSIIRSFGLWEDFPDDALQEAAEMPTEIIEDDSRVDLRDLLTVTIDGEDAKDIDDAISLEVISDEITRLWVHIADVSYYVEPGSAIDEEAFERGNSTYLIDRVLPMLPTELSYGICSLNPAVDRFAFTVSIDFNKSGKVMDNKLFKSIIKSDARLTYTQVNELFSGKLGDNNILEYEDMLLLARYLMKTLKGIRLKRGSIDFDFDETKIELDNKAFPIEIMKETRGEAEQLIEEFMIISNEVVAQKYGSKIEDFVYRIHGKPSIEKLSEFKKIANKFGYDIDLDNPTPVEFSELIEEAKGNPEEALISTLLLRSLQKASYSNNNEGHFGLASTSYTHFTAPIRRYSDLTVHRLLTAFIEPWNWKSYLRYISKNLPEICKSISISERKAEEAERQVLKFKMAQYMEERIGDLYEGEIASITNYGMYVKLPNTIEGSIAFSSIKSDKYSFDEQNYVAIGQIMNKRFSMGQKLTVKVKSVDMNRYSIDFELIEDDTFEKRKNKKNVSNK
ncbi:MAG: ribonuclease R [Tissierellia bacterium]|nr:ribonuclease R [Tissierellia bacterium]